MFLKENLSVGGQDSNPNRIWRGGEIVYVFCFFNVCNGMLSCNSGVPWLKQACESRNGSTYGSKDTSIKHSVQLIPGGSTLDKLPSLGMWME